MKNKYGSLFEKKYFPLSNVFINNLLKDEKYFSGTYSKDQIPLIEDKKSIIFNLQSSYEKGSHWVGLSRKNNVIYF